MPDKSHARLSPCARCNGTGACDPLASVPTPEEYTAAIVARCDGYAREYAARGYQRLSDEARAQYAAEKHLSDDAATIADVLTEFGRCLREGYLAVDALSRAVYRAWGRGPLTEGAALGIAAAGRERGWPLRAVDVGIWPRESSGNRHGIKFGDRLATAGPWNEWSER